MATNSLATGNIYPSNLEMTLSSRHTLYPLELLCLCFCALFPRALVNWLLPEGGVFAQQPPDPLRISQALIKRPRQQYLPERHSRSVQRRNTWKLPSPPYGQVIWNSWEFQIGVWSQRVPLPGLQFKVHHLLVTLSNLLYLSKSQCPHLNTKIITVLTSQGWRKDEMRS